MFFTTSFFFILQYAVSVLKSFTKSDRHEQPSVFRCIVLFLCWFCFSVGIVSVESRLFSADDIRLVETKESISIFRQDRLVLSYNKVSPSVPKGIDPVYQRSGFIHPVMTPAGTTVTATFPVDHPHQHGIFTAWVKTTYAGEAIDFWNLAGNTGDVRHARVLSKYEQLDSAGFEVELLHRRTGKVPLDILSERWKVVVHRSDNGYVCFDLHTVQENITNLPLTIEKYHYGGMGFRGPVAWLLPEDSDEKRKQPGDVTQSAVVGSRFLTSHGNNRIEGNHTHVKWVILTRGMESGDSTESASVAVLTHPDNGIGEQAVRLHPTKPYFSYSPCIDESFQIEANSPYVARYRYLLTDKEADPSWVQQQWELWTNETKSSSRPQSK